MKHFSLRSLFIVVLLLCLAGCKSLKKEHCPNSYDKNYNGAVKVGDPYSVRNKTYTPKIYLDYNVVGLASWYGHHFHCRKTANGEFFDKNQLSAAHNTLPLPSVVKVTNLINNKSVNVIINDRGPFVQNRIIDISERAAVVLGMKHHGVVKVRVEFLPEETNKLMDKINSNHKIYYATKTKHDFEIIVEHYKNQKTALTEMRKISKYGKVHLLYDKNGYALFLIAEDNKQANALHKQVTSMGYKNAKIVFY